METAGSEGEKKTSGIFLSNGKLHISHPIWKLATALLALPIGGVAVGSILSYRSFVSEIGSVVRNEIKNVQYNKDYTVFEKIGDLDGSQKTSKKQMVQLCKDVDDIFCFLNKGKNCRTRGCE